MVLVFWFKLYAPKQTVSIPYGVNMKIWARALDIAEQTPEDRNRYVDLLRALSILKIDISILDQSSSQVFDTINA